jgi:hypothetical protein
MELDDQKYARINGSLMCSYYYSDNESFKHPRQKGAFIQIFFEMSSASEPKEEACVHMV